MIDVKDATIARYKHKGNVFEALVDCEKAMELKHGKDIDILDIIASREIFSDSKKGQVASEHIIKEVFGTDNDLEAIKQIILKGEVHLTAEYKSKVLDEKKKKIIAKISQNAVDPRTKMPVPPKRIELAFEEAKIRIDEHKSEDEQINEIIKKLRPVLPLSFESVVLKVVVPAAYTGKAYSTIRQFGNIQNETWKENGDLAFSIKLPSAMQYDFIDRLNAITHGDVQIDKKDDNQQ